MRQVLVTGAAGFLGIHLVTELRDRRFAVIAVDDGSAGTWNRLAAFSDDRDVQIHRINITDWPALCTTLRNDRPWGVVHLAARHFIPDCQSHPEQAWRTNVTGTAHMLALTAMAKPARFLLASTADVYAAGDTPHEETDEIGPRTVYGRTKQLCEAMVLNAAQSNTETGFLIARLFNLYGPNTTVDHLIPIVARQAVAGNRIATGNLDTVRDYVFVADAAAALAELLNSPKSGIVNIGTGHGTSGREVIAHVGRAVARDLMVQHDPSRIRAIDRHHLVADPRRLKSLLAWWPATSIDKGIAMTVAAAGHGVDARQPYGGRSSG